MLKLCTFTKYQDASSFHFLGSRLQLLDVRFKGAIAINMSSSNISKDLCGKFTGWEGCAIQLYKIEDTVNVGVFQ